MCGCMCEGGGLGLWAWRWGLYVWRSLGCWMGMYVIGWGFGTRGGFEVISVYARIRMKDCKFRFERSNAQP